MKTSLVLILGLVLFTACRSSAGAQTIKKDSTRLTGVLLLDAGNIAFENNTVKRQQINLQMPAKKSRWLAGLFSLILPGAGEYYAGSYLKGAIFTVVEAAALTTALIYNHKGDFQTNFFQTYANANWDVSKYAAWTLKHVNDINPGSDVNPANYHVFRNNFDWSSAGNNTNWSQLNNVVNWGELNRLESDLGRGYTHQLPSQGEQQYYELIGKYPQYSHGWITSNFDDTDYHVLTDQFLWYSHQRGLANEYYKNGNTAVVFLYINHFLSVLDAIWTTDRYNSSIALKFRMERDHYAAGEQFVPTMHLSVNF